MCGSPGIRSTQGSDSVRGVHCLGQAWAGCREREPREAPSSKGNASYAPTTTSQAQGVRRCEQEPQELRFQRWENLGWERPQEGGVRAGLELALRWACSLPCTSGLGPSQRPQGWLAMPTIHSGGARLKPTAGEGGSRPHCITSGRVHQHSQLQGPGHGCQPTPVITWTLPS